mmetsp:Transcript_32024/g.73254  ORF Transcript_32024/g.73254 Transcript_32024/m.73254 type:complete len:179 (+) Transcript_32024:46-582(+)
MGFLKSFRSGDDSSKEYRSLDTPPKLSLGKAADARENEMEKVQVQLAGMKDALEVTQKLLRRSMHVREKDRARMQAEHESVEEERDELKRERDELKARVMKMETAHTREVETGHLQRGCVEVASTFCADARGTREKRSNSVSEVTRTVASPTVTSRLQGAEKGADPDLRSARRPAPSG